VKRLALVLATLGLVLAGTAGASAQRVPLRLTPAAATAMLAKGTFIDTAEVERLRDLIYDIESGQDNIYGNIPENLPRLKATLPVALRGHTVQAGSMSCVHYRGLAPVQGRYSGFHCALVIDQLDVPGYGLWPPAKPPWYTGSMNVLLGRNKCPYPGERPQIRGGWRHECISTPRYGYTWLTALPPS
jgi:hypothetical protein